MSRAWDSIDLKIKTELLVVFGHAYLDIYDRGLNNLFRKKFPGTMKIYLLEFEMKQLHLRLFIPCLFTLMLSIAGMCKADGYPTIASAGFHHCALIYHLESRNAEDLKPYVARYVNGKPTSDWLFDSFLFLTLTTESGKRTEVGETDKSDWLSILDAWFAPGRDLSALDDAITQTADAQGLPAPPSKRKIMFCIPWINPKVTNFGDVDGDGKSEDLSTAECRKKVIRWYLDEARRRFASAKFRNLELWGFYPIREDVANDGDTISMIAEEVHLRSEKLLWIPYFMARGWDKWRDYGIDVAIMQPNYAFRSWMDGGHARRNRLAVCADMAKSHGLGVEIEVRGNAASDFERRMFMQYLCDGAKNKYGYQDVPTAYYLDFDAVGALYKAKDAKSRETYDALCDYVVGKPVKDPDQNYKWKWTKSKGAKNLVATTVLPTRRYVSSIDVFLEDGLTDYWHGIVTAEVRKDKKAKWTPCAWVIRGNVDSLFGKHQVITVPIDTIAEEVRLVFRSEPGSPAMVMSKMGVNFEGPSQLKHLALGRGYTFSPAWPKPPYCDDGVKLTDSDISTAGSLVDGKIVGWQLYEDKASIVFDLGKSVPVSDIEMYTWGGGIYSINWPLGPVALLSNDYPISGFSGIGDYPSGIRMLAGSKPIIDRIRSDNDMDGHIIFTAKKPISARYVTIITGGQGWVMCSEVRILSNGKNMLSKNTPYTLTPLPSYNSDIKYADDGSILTDGMIASDFESRMLTGWEDDAIREIVVDLGKVKDLHKFTAWSLGGGQYSIHSPKSVIFSVSKDGITWSSVGVASAGAEPKKGTCGVVPYTLNLNSGVRGRYINVRVTRSQGWAVLSEISVQ